MVYNLSFVNYPGGRVFEKMKKLNEELKNHTGEMQQMTGYLNEELKNQTGEMQQMTGYLKLKNQTG